VSQPVKQRQRFAILQVLRRRRHRIRGLQQAGRGQNMRLPAGYGGLFI
jgi:hypothetical protein